MVLRRVTVVECCVLDWRPRPAVITSVTLNYDDHPCLKLNKRTYTLTQGGRSRLVIITFLGLLEAGYLNSEFLHLSNGAGGISCRV